MADRRHGLPFGGEQRPRSILASSAPQPTRRAAPYRRPTGVVTREGSALVIHFSAVWKPYIDAVKAIRGYRYDPTTYRWSVHVGQIREVRAAAVRHGWVMSTGVQAIPDIAATDVPMVVSAEGEQLTIDGPWRADVWTVLSEAKANLNPQTGKWLIPLERAVDTVLDLRRVAKVRFIGERTEIIERIELAERMLTLSRALAPSDAWQLTPWVKRTLRPFQHPGVEYMVTARRCFNWGTMGSGKALRNDQRVLTPTGWRAISDLAVDDEVLGGSTGRPVKVLGVFPQGVRPLWRVTTNDGASVIADADHQWAVKVAGSRGPGWRVVTTRDLLGEGIFRYQTPVPSRPGEYLNKIILPSLPMIDGPPVRGVRPYALGAWIGDGTWQAGNCTITTHAEDAHEMATRAGGGKVAIEEETTTGKFGLGMEFGRQLAVLGLDRTRSHERFIPRPFLHADRASRLALLQGLLDTDGSPDVRSSGIEYATTSEQLALGVVELVGSLGGIARMSGPRVTHYRHLGERRSGRPSWRINVKLLGTDTPFTVHRKAERYVAPTKYPPARRIADITEVEPAEATCIAVDDPAGLFITEGHIVTHNTLMAIAALEHQAWLDHCAGDSHDSPYPTLVVAPAGLKTSWLREFAAAVPHRSVHICEGKNPLLPLHEPDVWICNFDVLGLTDVVGRPRQRTWATEFIDLIRRGRIRSYVIDEGHRANNRKAQRTVAILEASKALAPTATRYLLTGTPVRNRRAEVEPQLAAIGREGEFGDVATIKADKRLSRKMRTVCAWRPDPAAVLRSLGVLKADGTADPVVQRVIIDGDPVVLAEYRRAEENFLDYLRDKARAKAIELGQDPESAAVQAAIKAGSAEQLMLIGTLCRLAGQAKIKAAREWVSDFEATGAKLLVFCENHDMMDAVSGGRIPQIRGGIKHAERTRLCDRFQDEDWIAPAERLQTLVLQIVAAGEGLTLTKAYDVMFAQLAWTPGAHDQAAARAAWRMNDPHNVLCHYLIAADTIDEMRMDILDSKRAEMATVTDGDLVEQLATTSTYGDVFARMLNRALGLKDQP